MDSNTIGISVESASQAVAGARMAALEVNGEPILTWQRDDRPAADDTADAAEAGR